MTGSVERRQVLVTLAALPLLGCSRAHQAQEAQPQAPATAQVEALDLTAVETRFKGRMGLAVHDVTRNRMLAWRAEERFVYCSSFKMFLAAATLLRVQAGEEQLDRQIPITRADMLNHAPVTEPAIGRSLSIQQLMKGTVEVSDNPAANILIREMGGLEPLRAFYRGIGDETTRVDRMEPEMNRWDGDKDTIQPLQAAANLKRLLIDADTPLDAASKSMLLRWMIDSPTGMDRIKAAVPAGWTVAHKTGTGGYGPAIDIGVLYPPSNAPIIVAAYFHGSPESTEAGREAAIAEATRMALGTLGVI